MTSKESADLRSDRTNRRSFSGDAIRGFGGQKIDFSLFKAAPKPPVAKSSSAPQLQCALCNQIIKSEYPSNLPPTVELYSHLLECMPTYAEANFLPAPWKLKDAAQFRQSLRRSFSKDRTATVAIKKANVSYVPCTIPSIPPPTSPPTSPILSPEQTRRAHAETAAAGGVKSKSLTHGDNELLSFVSFIEQNAPKPKSVNNAAIYSEAFINKLLDHAGQSDSGLEIRDRRWKFRTFKTCFIACEFVEWLVENFYAANKKEALAIGKQMQEMDVISHVTHAHDFKDRPLFFRFNKDNSLSSSGKLKIGRRGDNSSPEKNESLPRLSMALLSEILHSSIMCTFFRQCLFKSLCLENLEVWKQIEYWKSLDPLDRIANAHILKRTYLVDGAPFEVNIQYADRHKVLDLLAKKPETLETTFFDSIQTQVMLLMYQDSLPKFLKENYLLSKQVEKSFENPSHLKSALLTENDWKIITNGEAELTVEIGEKLLESDKHYEHMFLLCSGSVLQKAPDGTIISITQEYSILGVGLLFGSTTKFTTLPQSPSTVKKIDIGHLSQLLLKDPIISHKFFVVIGEQLRKQNAQLKEVLTRNRTATVTIATICDDSIPQRVFSAYIERPFQNYGDLYFCEDFFIFHATQFGLEVKKKCYYASIKKISLDSEGLCVTVSAEHLHKNAKRAHHHHHKDMVAKFSYTFVVQTIDEAKAIHDCLKSMKEESTIKNKQAKRAPSEELTETEAHLKERSKVVVSLLPSVHDWVSMFSSDVCHIFEFSIGDKLFKKDHRYHAVAQLCKGNCSELATNKDGVVTNKSPIFVGEVIGHSHLLSNGRPRDSTIITNCTTILQILDCDHLAKVTVEANNGVIFTRFLYYLALKLFAKKIVI